MGIHTTTNSNESFSLLLHIIKRLKDGARRCVLRPI